MTAAFAGVTRQQLPQLQVEMTQLGALQSATFKGVGPVSADIYDLKFENGSAGARIFVGSDGKVESVGLRPQ